MYELNWILSWNEWITQFFNRYLPFLMISPLFCLFWTLFGQFLGTFPIRPVLIIPWLLNWIIFWIESPEFILNWIIFWIESWVKQYWIKYWMNHFLAKFKYWIESDWVSLTTSKTGLQWRFSLCCQVLQLRGWAWEYGILPFSALHCVFTISQCSLSGAGCLEVRWLWRFKSQFWL